MATRRRRHSFRILRDANARRLGLAHLTSAAGDGMVLAALPFAVHAAGGTDAQFSIALAAQALAMALFFLPAGAIGDKLNRRNVLVASDLMRFCARGAFAVLLLAGAATFWELLVVQAVNGAGTALFATTTDGFVPDAFGEESRLQDVNALRVLALSLGLTAGPAIGGAIYAASGAASVFAADALTFLASAALISALPTRRSTSVRSRAARPSLIGDLGEAWAAFRAISWYWRVVSQFAVLNTFVFAPYFVIGPHVAMDSLGGASAWAAILAGLGAGELLGAPIAMALRPRRPLLVAVSAVAAWILPLLLLAAVAPVPALAAASVLAGISSAMMSTIWDTVKQTQTPSHLRARLCSFDNLGSLGLVPVGYLLGGVMLGLLGATAALIGGALVVAVVTFCVVADPSVREVGDLRG